MKTFITTIPMLVELKAGIYQPTGFKWEHNRETRFPIIPVIEEVLWEDEDDLEILAIVIRNVDSERNYERFLKELEEIGVDSKAVKRIEIAEDPSEQVGFELMKRLLGAISDDSDIYACVTYGTKIVSMLVIFALIFVEKLKVNCKVQGMYYGEVRREHGQEVERRLYNLVKYLQLGSIVDQIQEMEVADAGALFGIIADTCR